MNLIATMETYRLVMDATNFVELKMDIVALTDLQLRQVYAPTAVKCFLL
jgi:hypothetical protein